MAIQPIIITTWKFGLAACEAGITRLRGGASALDAVEAAANVTELDPKVNSVGYGGLPNAAGVVELDAAIMDGATHRAGSVAGVTTVRRPLSLARRVMEHCPHTMLVGANADQFARREGFPSEELLTEESRRRYAEWRKTQGEADVAHFDLGPTNGKPPRLHKPVPDDHDTIGLCALDSHGNLAVGCTTSGMSWKVPGRVGDSPIIGSGLYVDNKIGAAAATGHGDEIMQACLSYRVVMKMEEGWTPEAACIEALRYLLRKRPPEQHNHYGAALIALRKDGTVGAAATLSGFHHPDRLWQWAVVGREWSEPTLKEGCYVASDDLILSPDQIINYSSSR